MQSIKISGTGTINGGQYDEIITTGSAKIKGKVKCDLFKTSGSINSDSSVEAREFKTSGSAKIEGNLKIDEGKSSGAIRVEGKIDADEFSVSGSMVVSGDVNVDHFTAKISNGSFVNIYGDKISINEGEIHGSVFFHDVVKNIKAESIEATEIYIKDVTVDRVSGDKVFVDEGCTVRVVEYRDSLDISLKTKIDTIIKL